MLGVVCEFQILYMADQHTSFRIKERYFAVKVSEIAKHPFGLFTFKISQ